MINEMGKWLSLHLGIHFHRLIVRLHPVPDGLLLTL
jgi:hypothetical protein